MSRRRRGAQAVEFALILPVMLALMTSMMDFSWLLLHRHVAGEAATAGARAASLSSGDVDPAAVAVQAADARWSEFPLWGQPVFEVRTTADVVAVAVTLQSVALIGFVPGPDEFTVVRTRALADR
ncbi:MAG: pilus assembly protein [Myxococcales bacterium]|nr:pilus assembly protein [Myxococcales bacterium]